MRGPDRCSGLLLRTGISVAAQPALMSPTCAAVLLPALIAVQGCGARTAEVADPPTADRELVRIEQAVGTALACAPSCPPFVSQTKLLSVSRAGNAIVMDFSGELLSGGTGGVLEDELHRLLAAASSARSTPRPAVEDYRILITGVPLDALR